MTTDVQPAATETDSPRLCAYCGKPLPPRQRFGKPRTTCDASCRVALYWLRRAARELDRDQREP